MQTNLGQWIKNAIHTMTPLIMASMLPFLFYRELFSIDDYAYGWRGINGIQLISLFTLLLINGLLTNFHGEKPKISKRLFAFVLTSYLPAAIVIFTVMLAVVMDPWLRASWAVNWIYILGPFWIVIGGVASYFGKKKYPELLVEQKDVLQNLRHFMSKRIPTIVLLVLIVVLGLILRLQNVANFSPTVDEFPHFKNAIYIIEGIPVEYSRAYWTVTMPVAVSFKLFGISLASARFPVVLFSMLATVPLYFLMKRFGRWTAILSVFLYAINPSTIVMAQLTRDYAPAAIFIYLVFLLTSPLLRADLKGGFLDLWGKYQKNILVLILAFVFIFLDQKSISSVALANFVVFAAVFGIKILSKYRHDRKKLYAALGIIFFIIVGLLVFATKFRLEQIELTSKYWDLLTVKPMVNWSYFFPWISYILLAFIAFEIVKYFFDRQQPRDHVLFTMSIVFVALFAYSSLFLFAGKLNPRARYYVVFVYYLLPIAAIAFHRGIRWIEKITGNQPLFHSLFITLALFFFWFA